MGLQAIQVITSFLAQTPVDDDHDVSEFTLARMTAEFICNTMESKRVIEADALESVRSEVDYAVKEAAKNFVAAGKNPFERPVR